MCYELVEGGFVVFCQPDGEVHAWMEKRNVILQKLHGTLFKLTRRPLLAYDYPKH